MDVFTRKPVLGAAASTGAEVGPAASGAPWCGRATVAGRYMFSFHGCFGVDPTRTHSIALSYFLSRDSSEDWAGAA